MSVLSDRLIEALRARGHRITDARRAICEVIAASPGAHLDAAAIHRRVVVSTGLRIAASTVYRTLDALEQSGLLVHTHLGHRPAVYHLAEEAAHQHFVCDQCGATVAVSADDLAAWSQAIRERTGFVIESSHFALTGICAECAAAVEHPTGQA